MKARTGNSRLSNGMKELFLIKGAQSTGSDYVTTSFFSPKLKIATETLSKQFNSQFLSANSLI